MVEKIYTPEQLETMEKYIDELLNYVNNHDSRPLPGCFEYCKIILKNIEICRNDDWNSMKELSAYIKADWKDAMEIHTGLPEYYIPDENIDVQCNLNQVITDYMIKIDKCISGINV